MNHLRTSLGFFAVVAGTSKQAVYEYRSPEQWLAYRWRREMAASPDPADTARLLHHGAVTRLREAVAESAGKRRRWTADAAAADLRVAPRPGDTVPVVLARFLADVLDDVLADPGVK